MNENPAAKLFKEPAIWPSVAPWWLVSSTEAAALLNVKPTALHTWRARGYGPPVFPPMYVRPTQGNPLFYQFGALRNWAASKVGMAYSYEDQCLDFFRKYLPFVINDPFQAENSIHMFELAFDIERKNAQKRQPTVRLALGIVHELDLAFSRQPELRLPTRFTGSVISRAESQVK